MQITVEKLKALNACEEGIREFERIFPNGIDVPEWTEWCQGVILSTPLRKYFAWAVSLRLFPIWSMRDINLSGADLSGANLSRANLSGADTTDAKGIIR